MNPLLELKNVVKKYGDKTAIDNVSLTVPRGSIYGMLGPNGAGKTSIIRIINQISTVDSGQVLLDNELLQPKHISMIGYMPEERGLYKSMKVGEQAIYLAQLKGMSKVEAKKALEYWFDKFEIKHWWGKKIQELSKGMAQKIQFIVTVMHQPKLLILDEPFSGFDPVNANLIKDEIIALKNAGSTIMLSTHRMESVEEMCDDIALIHQSKKWIEGKLLDVKKQYRTNSYDIEITPNNESLLMESLKNFSVIKTSFKTLNQALQLRIELNDFSEQELLMLLLSHGKVTHFNEHIPSINDIFIQTVTQN